MTLETQINPRSLGPGAGEKEEGKVLHISFQLTVAKSLSLEVLYFLPCVMLLDLISFLPEDTLVSKAMTYIPTQTLSIWQHKAGSA